MDFFEKLLAHKALNKLGWKKIGDVIDMKEATIRIAVDRKSLSDLEQRELSRHFFGEGQESDKDTTNLEGAIEVVVKNQDEALENILFREFVDKLLYKRLNDLKSDKL